MEVRVSTIKTFQKQYLKFSYENYKIMAYLWMY